MQARGEAMSSKSLDHPMGEDGDEAYGDLVGDVDGDLEYVEMREAVREVLHKLPEREREILLMRFYGEHTQSEIAERLGLSQVHVSRLITRTLAALRDNVVNDVPLPRSWSEELVTTTAAARRAA
jgi:RNA polymerase sigma-B factor